MKSGLLFVAAALGIIGCDRGKSPAAEGTPVPTPTVMVDSTRTEGPPITFEELERGIVGRWRADASVTDPQMAQELVYFPNGVWVTPSHKGVGGKYNFVDNAHLHVTQPTSGNDLIFRFTLIGDELNLYYKDTPHLFHRVRIVAPTPAVLTPTPSA